MSALESFIPAFVRRWAAGHPQPAVDLAWPVPGAVLSADIAGFTALTEQLAARGPSGIEAIQGVLNRSFARVVECVDACGGEVIKFAGDATIAWWPARDTLRQSLLGAAACARRLAELVPHLQRETGFPLGIRVAIGAGDAYTAIVGGVDGRWEGLLGGEPLRQLAAQHDVRPGEVSISLEAWPLVREYCAGDERPTGVVLRRAPDMPVPGPAIADGATPPAVLRGFVPRHVADAAGKPPARLAELRTVSVLFAAPAPEWMAPGALPAAENLQSLVETMQGAVREFNGSLIQLLVDDRATLVMVAAWGVPESASEGHAERAVRAGQALHTRLKAAGTAVSIGIATGRVFSGLRGGPSRVEYALIGRVMNLAARLMQSSVAQVQCDYATARAAGETGFTEAGTLDLKGLGQVRVFQPGAAPSRQRPPDHLVGRADELARLRSTLQMVIEAPARSAAILIEGEPGVGKSHLAEAFIREAESRGLMVGTGATDPYDTQTPYRLLRAAFPRLLGIGPAAPVAERQARVFELLQGNPGLREKAPLANPILDLGLPENETTSTMSGVVRSASVVDLLLELLNGVRRAAQPRVLLLDDVQWMDSASGEVVQQLVRRAEGFCVVLVTRPIQRGAQTEPAALRAFAEDGRTVRISLVPLDEQHAGTLMAQILGVSDVPAELAAWAREKAGGHPLFLREVLASAAEAGAFRRRGDDLVVEPQRLREVSVPENLAGLLEARLDRLTADQRYLLKVASVLGQSFTADGLASLSGDRDVSTADSALRGMLTTGLLRAGDRDGEYVFSHGLTRHAARESLLPSERLQLNAAAATWYERHWGHDANYWVVIAHHWTDAEDADHAPAALERAGNHAIKTGAYREAQTLFGRLASVGEHGFGAGAGDRIRHWRGDLGRWFLKLGVAEHNVGKLKLARRHLTRAAELLGYPVPRSPLRMNLAVIRELGRQAARRVLPVRLRPRRNPQVGEAAQALNMLARVYSVAQRPVPTLYTVLRGFNLLERLEPSPELIEATGAMGYLAGLLGMDRLADRYARAIAPARATRPLEYANGMYALAVGYLATARWDACRRAIAEALEIHVRLGDRQGRLGDLGVLGNVDELQGRLSGSLATYRQMAELAEETGDSQREGWGLGGCAMIALRQGRITEAVDFAVRARVRNRRADERVSYLSMVGTLAIGYLRIGDTARARSFLREASRLLKRQPQYPTAHHNLNGYETVAEAVLALWQLDSGSPRSEFAAPAALACGVLRRYARVFPIGRSIAALWTGLERWLQGRRRQAFASWRRAVAEGERLGIPYDTARAHLEIARHAPPGSRERAEHAAAALRISTGIDARGLVPDAAALT